MQPICVFYLAICNIRNVNNILTYIALCVIMQRGYFRSKNVRLICIKPLEWDLCLLWLRFERKKYTDLLGSNTD